MTSAIPTNHHALHPFLPLKNVLNVDVWIRQKQSIRYRHIFKLYLFSLLNLFFNENGKLRVVELVVPQISLVSKGNSWLMCQTLNADPENLDWFLIAHLNYLDCEVQFSIWFQVGCGPVWSFTIMCLLSNVYMEGWMTVTSLGFRREHWMIWEKYRFLHVCQCSKAVSLMYSSTRTALVSKESSSMSVPVKCFGV